MTCKKVWVASKLHISSQIISYWNLDLCDMQKVWVTSKLQIPTQNMSDRKWDLRGMQDGPVWVTSKLLTSRPGQQKMNIDYMISRDNTRPYEEPWPDKNECAFLHMSLTLNMFINLWYMKNIKYDISMISIICYWLCLLNSVIWLRWNEWSGIELPT